MKSEMANDDDLLPIVEDKAGGKSNKYNNFGDLKGTDKRK
jgi:hypothetical protein